MRELSSNLTLDYEDKWQEYEFRGAADQVQKSKEPEIIIGGPADTGKTLAVLTHLNKLAWEYPGMRACIVRRFRTSMVTTVLETFRRRVLTGWDGGHVRVYGGESPSWFDYPGGSRIYVAGMDKDSKILSAEFDVIYVNQAEELGLPSWETLSTRCTGRSGVMPYGQLIGDCNPANPTHWIRTRASTDAMTYLESFHRDNPELFDDDGQMTHQGEMRLGRLSDLTGARRKRLFQGVWAQPEGAIYDIFDETKHKVKSFKIPAHWPRIVGIDPLGAYISGVWLAYEPEAGVLHAYREYYEPFGVTTPDHVREILRRSHGETIFAWVGGSPSERQQRADFAGAGLPLQAPPLGEVWTGIDRVYQLLKDNALFIHDSCDVLLSEIGDYRRKEKDGEVTDDILNKNDYHMLDALRYAIIYLTEPGEQEELIYNPVQFHHPGWDN